MSSRNAIKIVEDLVAEGVSAKEVEHLLEITAYAVERIAPTLARRAEFHLSDFKTAKRRGVAGFMLTLTRQRLSEQEMWTAEFTREAQRLRVLLTLTPHD